MKLAFGEHRREDGLKGLLHHAAPLVTAYDRKTQKAYLERAACDTNEFAQRDDL